MRIGVLALQGSVAEHINKLKQIESVVAIEVKTKDALRSVDALILPGGESTTISKLLHDFDLFDLLKSRIVQGLPVWGTCAGMILLAKAIVGESPHLAVMDITVKRNAYGSQLDSFSTSTVIPAVSKNVLELTFIRAPWVESVGEGADILCSIEGHIVAVRQKNMLVTSFHPELTEDMDMHRYFVDMAIKSVAMA